MAEARDSLERKVTPIPKLFSSLTFGKAVSGQDSGSVLLINTSFPVRRTLKAGNKYTEVPEHGGGSYQKRH